MTTLNQDFLKQVAGAGGGKGIPANGPRDTISAPPAHPPYVSMAPAPKQ
jgi:hypothetical protein